MSQGIKFIEEFIIQKLLIVYMITFYTNFIYSKALRDVLWGKFQLATVLML